MSIKTNSIVSIRMKQRRKELGLRADDVAKALGVSRATVFRYESGGIEKIPFYALSPLASALSTSVSWLTGWSESKDMENEQFTKEQMGIFSENLKRLMDQKGVDQQTVANAIGVSCATVSYYATAKKYPRLKNLLALCNFFGVDLDELRNPYESISTPHQALINLVLKIPDDKAEAMIGAIENILSVAGIR